MKKKPYTKKELEEFIRESNYIEREYSDEAFEDAMKAWKYAESRETMTLESILEIHRLLMQRLRPDVAGQWRTCDVWIGGKKKKFFGIQKIEEDMKDFIGGLPIFLPGKKETNENFAEFMHICFESRHPHEDGNGRTGRIIWNWHRLKMGLSLKIIHADIGDFYGKGEQRAYYDLFKDN